MRLWNQLYKVNDRISLSLFVFELMVSIFVCTLIHRRKEERIWLREEENQLTILEIPDI